PALTSARNIVIGPGTPAQIYVPSDEQPSVAGRGIQISPDGGASWLVALAGIGIAGLAADPADPAHLHQVAWRGEAGDATRKSGPELYETRDGWATSIRADQGLPPALIQTVAFDPANA